jgi:PAS domain S-box-containing protein
MNVGEDQSRPTLDDAFDALRRSGAQLRAFIDELPALAWCLLPDGSIELFHQQWHTYTGLSAEEMCGSGWKSAVHTDGHRTSGKLVTCATFTWCSFECEMRVLRKRGQYRWHLTLKDQQGHTKRWVVPAIEIEDRKRLEKRLQHENVALREEIDKASCAKKCWNFSGSPNGAFPRL